MIAILEALNLLLPWLILVAIGMAVAHETVKASRR